MPLYLPTAFPRVAPAAGQYAFTSSPSAVTTSATLGTGTLRLVPWVITRTTAIDRIGAEVTTIGDAGSKFRIGVYADTGNCYPGSLLLDAGQIAGDSATLQDLTVSLTLAAGLYWVGGAVQTVTTTQPTMRVTSNWYPQVPVSVGTAAPAAGTAVVGNSQGSVTGALPGTFTASATGAGSAARIHVRVA
jgi:hypothetical protein